MITQKRLKEILHYDPEAGIFIWLESNGSGVYKYDIAGSRLSGGYILIEINGERYYSHKLAWFYVHGVWPKEELDHIDHDTSNDRIVNLREVTHKENQKNQSLAKNNTSGVTGVSWYKPLMKWVTYISVNGKPVTLGYFNDWFEAVCSRKSANNKHGYHKNHGAEK